MKEGKKKKKNLEEKGVGVRKNLTPSHFNPGERRVLNRSFAQPWVASWANAPFSMSNTISRAAHVP